MGPSVVEAALSPYFAKHKAVVQGFTKLHSLFQWRAMGSSDGDTDFDVCKGALPPPDTQYLQVMDILYNIQESIDPVKDGQPSQDVYTEARACYNKLLALENVCEPLLSNRVFLGTSSQHSCLHDSHKRTGENSAQGLRPLKRMWGGA